ncbi:MAG: BACON domain-containing carbohydrate-binding protein [Bacteroidales bacterium]|uniref:BACON domain-containing protein n=1 Tax=Porphyromonas sp. TaxID=1924944 RepID=UPI0029721BFC|nr:BACON domain-containing carbohydrate-binding protein [Porphyromonas sp.]MDD7438676.1 BACON domain-containing carbohydrate-binding protein [Bacteroidales bacterium]MDY3066934.1 BACON domain-containing carbohydrate-binding protein [Porphyromonas sp.]
MKHFNYLTAFAVTLLIGLFASCTPKSDEPEEATLSLSTNAVTIPNAGGEAQAITVTTNQTKWNAISNAEWLKTTVSGNTLTIVATPNQSGADRVAEVLVVAGTSEKVSVIQSAADIVLEVSPANVVVTNAGETKLVSVKSNATTWTLEVDEAASAWIKRVVFKDFIQLEIAPNTGDAREAKLYAKSGTTQKEITIQQAGKGAKFVLPYLVVNAVRYQLLSYEASQGSFLLGYTEANPGLPSWGIPPAGESYTFATASAAFPSVFYSFNYDTSLMEVIEYVGTIPTADVVANGFLDFLKENGYEDIAYTSNKVSAYHPENRFSLEMGDSKEGIAILHFNAPGPEQPQDYKTFDKFPYDSSYMLGDTQYTAPKVKEIESKANSKVIEEKEDSSAPGYIQYIQYEVAESSRPLHTRLYFFDNKTKDDAGKPLNNVSEFLAVWAEHTLGVWELKQGAFYLTKEFKALLKKEGFEFYAKNNGNDYYYHAGKKLMVVPRGARFTDVLDGNPVFAMNYFLYEKDSSSTKARQEAIQKISDRIAELDKALGRK